MTTQAMHTRLTVALMSAAMGDLMLIPGNGSLAYRETYDESTGRDYPREISKPGQVLARISAAGWTLTAQGAQFILENCPPINARDLAALRAIAEAKAAPLLTLRIDDSTQYATLYSNGLPVASLQRRRVISREPWAWRVSDLRGNEVFAFTRSDTPRAMARIAFEALESANAA